MAMNRRSLLAGVGIAGFAAVANASKSGASPTAPQLATVDVKSHGAVGDGVTDDTKAIQSAINAAVAAGGGQVFLPAGQYRLTYKVTLGSGIELKGVGSASVLKPEFSERPPNRVIDNDWVNGNSNISLRNFNLDRSGPNVKHGILVNGVDNLLIDGVEISGTPSVASGCISVSGVGPWIRLVSKNVRIVNCVLSETENFGMHFGYVDGGVMANNTAYNAGREVFGVEPDPGVSSTNVVISGNSILGTTKVNGTTTGLIIVTTTSGGSVSGVTISGNVMRQPAVSDTSNPGISVLGATAVSVTGNTVHDMDGSGISIGSADIPTTGVLVTGNMIYNCGRTGGLPGIRLRNAHRCSVTGNYVYSSDSFPSLAEEAGATGNQIGTNFFGETPLGEAPSQLPTTAKPSSRKTT